MIYKVLTVILIIIGDFTISTEIIAKKEPKKKWNIDIGNLVMFKEYLKVNMIDESDSNKISSISEVTAPVKCECGKNSDFNSNACDTRERKFVNRYIKLFLYLVELKDKEVDANYNPVDYFTIDLSFTITTEDLLFLKKISENTQNLEHTLNWEKIDSIISKGFILKANEKQTTIDFIKKLISLIPNYVLSILFVSVLSVIIVALKNGSKTMMFLMVINNCIITDGVIAYNEKIKMLLMKEEEEYFRKFNAEKDSQSWWGIFSGISNVFSEESHYQSKDKIAEFSVLDSVIDSYGYFLFEKPLRIIGSASEAYSTAVNRNQSFLISWLFKGVSSVFILIVVVSVLVLGLLRPTMRINFLGTRIELGFAGRTQVPHIVGGDPHEGDRLQEISQSPDALQREENRNLKLESPRGEEIPIESIGDSASEPNSKSRESSPDKNSEAEECVKSEENHVLKKAVA